MDLRKKELAWGPRTLRRKVRGNLHRHKSINQQRGCRVWQRFEHPAPNSVWQMDVRGQILTLTGSCQLLTILDDRSRFSLCLKALPSEETDNLQQSLEDIFRCYGLPDRLLVYNGSLWGEDSEFLPTTLTAWLVGFGVLATPRHSEYLESVDKNQKFYRALEEEILVRYPFKNVAHLQEKLSRWRYEYNFERPHDSLDLAVPASRYQTSLKSFPEHLHCVDYGGCIGAEKLREKRTFDERRDIKISSVFS